MESTILLVDDNDAQRYAVAKTLKSSGFKVLEASTGKQALEKARMGIDLVILDINLPDIDGFEVCKRLKNNLETKSIPVLHLTATYLSLADKVRGLEGGADGYLTQPIKPAELLSTVRALIRMKKAEESRETELILWQNTFNSIQDAICLLDTKGTIVRYNRTFQDLAGNTEQGILGKQCHEVMHFFLDCPEDCPIRRFFDSPMPQIRERVKHEIRRGDHWFISSLDPVISKTGTIEYYVHLMRDITEQKTAELTIQRALREKEILIQELYHRARNNMQVMASLLQLYADRLKGAEEKLVLKDIETKIHVMALAHQKLYESENPSYVNLNGYLKDLSMFVWEVVAEHASKTEVSFQGIETYVLIDTAIPLGLAVNELLTNALRHAFPNGKEGKIDVRLSRGNANEILIDVIDDGIGMPKGFSIDQDGRLGLPLAVSLIENQLGGKISYESKKGVTWHISIAKELYSRRV